MIINGFIWLESIVDKLASKHAVSTDEVLQVFDEELYFAGLKAVYTRMKMFIAPWGKPRVGDISSCFSSLKQMGAHWGNPAREMTESEKKRYAQR